MLTLCIHAASHVSSVEIHDATLHRLVNQTRALGIALLGAPDFFKPRCPLPYFWSSPGPDTVSYYDVSPDSKTTLRTVNSLPTVTPFSRPIATPAERIDLST